MAIQIIRDQGVYFGGYDLQGRTNAVALEYGAEPQDVTCLGDTTRKRIGGLKNVAAAINGFMDIDSADLALFSGIGANTPITLGLAGDADNDICAFFNAIEGEISFGAEVGNALPFQAKAEAYSDKLVRGNIMLQSRAAALTASGNGTARQLGAVAAGKKMYLALHVWQVGTGSVTVKVQSDATNSFSGSQTDRITANAASAVGGQFLSVAGSITDTWWRINYTISGGAPSFKILAALGIL